MENDNTKSMDDKHNNKDEKIDMCRSKDASEMAILLLFQLGHDAMGYSVELGDCRD